MSVLETKSDYPVPQRKRFHTKTKYKLFLMAFPFIILVFLFAYLPLYGWIYSLYDYTPGIPLSETKFLGFYWFKSIVSNPTQTQEVLRVLRNTFALSGLQLLTSFVPMLFAILLMEVTTNWFKKVAQVLTTLPHFISWVLVYSFAFMLFNVDSGVINHLLLQFGWISRSINFLARDNHTWLSMTFWNLWKTIGWSAIIYIASMTGIDQNLYDAAKVDGAGRFRQIWHVTVPGLTSTYFVLMVLFIAQFINNGFDQYFMFQNPMNESHIEVLDLYVYNVGLAHANYAYGTTVSILKSLVSLGLLFFANGLSKWVRGESVV